MDIICILWILWIYPHFVDIIFNGHIMSYLACNVRTILHIYSYFVCDLCITYFPVCNLICFSVPSYFRLVSFVGEYKFNPNPIRIYLPSFITSMKNSFSFSLNFQFACCIGVLYCNIPQYIHTPDRG